MGARIERIGWETSELTNGSLSMYVLNKSTYDAWVAIPDPGIRYWIRLWLDGLCEVTHPAWAFSPFCHSTLGGLWDLYLPSKGEEDRGRPQRRAIRDLARLHADIPDGALHPVPAGEDDAAWTAYFQSVRSGREKSRAALFSWLLPRLENGFTSVCSPELKAYLSSLIALLMFEGRSDRELFVRLGTGVVDAKKLRPGSTRERAKGLVQHLERGDSSPFLIRTAVHHKGVPLSNTLARRLASEPLDGANPILEGSKLIRTADGVYAMTRCLASHSLTAFIQHRSEGWHLLRLAESRMALTGLSLHAKSEVTLESSDKPASWTHQTDTVSFTSYLPPRALDVEPEAFALSLAALKEDPEKSIALICDALNRRLGMRWELPAAERYNGSLRNALTRRVAIAVRETRDRWEKEESRPSWLAAVPEGLFDFVAVAAAIRSSGSDADELLAERLELVAAWPVESLHVRSTLSMLTLAKGIRNREVHEKAFPRELRPVMRYLARLMIHVFAACFPRGGQDQELWVAI